MSNNYRYAEAPKVTPVAAPDVVQATNRTYAFELDAVMAKITALYAGTKIPEARRAYEVSAIVEWINACLADINASVELEEGEYILVTQVSNWDLGGVDAHLTSARNLYHDIVAWMEAHSTSLSTLKLLVAHAEDCLA